MVVVFVEPVSVPKCRKIVQADILCCITYMKPSYEEVIEIAQLLGEKNLPNANVENLVVDMAIVQRCARAIIAAGVRCLLVSLGKDGVYLSYATDSKRQHVNSCHIPALPVKKVVNTNGAGDCFCAGFIWGLLHLQSEPIDKYYSTAILYGMRAARLNLQSHMNVATELSIQTLTNDI